LQRAWHNAVTMPTRPTISMRDATQLAIEHHRAGRLSEAESICRQILKVDKHNFGALYLLGVTAVGAERYRDAVDLIRRAIATNPAIADAHSHLGDACLALGELDAAASSYRVAIKLNPAHADAHNGLGVVFHRRDLANDAAMSFRRAVDLSPDWAVAHFNLGLALRDAGSVPAAAREFRTAWMLDPDLAGAARAFVDSTADGVRAGPSASLSESLPAHDAPSVSIIYCSIDDRKTAATADLYRRLFAGYRHEVIAIGDASSLAEAYNRGVAASVGDIVILSHDDVDILAPDFASRLHGHLRRFDVVGVIGATEMTGPSWSWSRHPHLRGWITHRPSPEGAWRAGVVDPRPCAGDLLVLDGVFIAARRHVFDKVTFDEETFDGFHLYDIDWSYRVAQAGFRLAAAGDLLLVHESVGRYDRAWAAYADRFCAKHAIEDLPPPPPAQLFEAIFRSPDEVRSFFACLIEMDQ
jgi:tetratricopeptide (TPR) repeat protein